MPLLSGATAAGFKIVRLLGCGPTGEVYLAEHPRLPRRHVLKILPADVSADPDYREWFNRESDRAAALWHPNIVGLHDRGEFEGRLWLLVDYVDGTSASELLSDSYPDGMPPDEVVEIVGAIADALDYAHDHGLLHRHVRPTNILTTQSESDKRRILLADLGIARHVDDVNGSTQTSITVDTVRYAAPEQLMGGSIDGRADQYGLASTAFHLLTGLPPFAHSNPAVVISKHLTESPPLPGDVRPELAHLDEPFSRALAKVPSDRFPRCQDFAKALEGNHRKQFNLQHAAATAVVTGPPLSPLPEPVLAMDSAVDAETDAAWLTEPTTAPTPPAAQADHGPAGIKAWSDTEIGDPVTSAEAGVSGAASDDQPVLSRGHLLSRAAAVTLAVTMVVVGFFIVMALRSRSELGPAPPDVETPSSPTTISPAPPPPATTPSLPRAATPAPTTITPPTTTTLPSPPSTPSPAQSKSLASSTMPPTTTPPSPPTTTPAAGIDSRPAIGMPCTPQQAGATGTSNSGAPISCVSTPGGFAWQSAGG